MELHQLFYIIKVAEFKNFSKAAEAACVTQPTLSNQIMKLENELGVKLFKRCTRSVSLTPVGEEIVAHASKVVKELELINKAAQTTLQNSQVKIATMLNSKNFGLTKSIVMFQEQCPNVSIQFEEAGFQIALQSVLNNEVDAAILIPVATFKNRLLKMIPLIQGEVVVIVNKGHRLAKKETISLKELQHERLWFPPRNYSMYTDAYEACSESDFEPHIAGECALETMCSLIDGGSGIGFATDFLAPNNYNNIVAIPIRPKLERIAYLVFNKKQQQNRAVTDFCNFITSSYNNFRNN